MTPWTVAYWAPLSMRFSRQEYWSRLPFSSPGEFPDPGLNLGLPHCRQTLYHCTGGRDQNHPQEEEMQKGKELSEEVFQITVKRRKAKGKREKERYTHLNAEFRRIAKRNKKAFLSDQCKEIEENNRIGKTRDLFKKIRDTKGTCHVKMGSINGRDLIEAEDIKKRWQEYTEELYKKDFHDLDNHDGVVTHLDQTSWNEKLSGP